jgi:hypothetical protein
MTRVKKERPISGEGGAFPYIAFQRSRRLLERGSRQARNFRRVLLGRCRHPSLNNPFSVVLRRLKRSQSPFVILL